IEPKKVTQALDDESWVEAVTPPKSDMQRNGNHGVLRQSTTIKI
ncbi:hypothetical protein Tco_0632156, partial [Tanacetum coccineum]